MLHYIYSISLCLFCVLEPVKLSAQNQLTLGVQSGYSSGLSGLTSKIRKTRLYEFRPVHGIYTSYTYNIKGIQLENELIYMNKGYTFLNQTDWKPNTQLYYDVKPSFILPWSYVKSFKKFNLSMGPYFSYSFGGKYFASTLDTLGSVVYNHPSEHFDVGFQVKSKHLISTHEAYKVYLEPRFLFDFTHRGWLAFTIGLSVLPKGFNSERISKTKRE